MSACRALVTLSFIAACSRAQTASMDPPTSSSRLVSPPMDYNIPSAAPTHAAPSASASNTAAHCITPESVGAVALTELKGTSDKERRALAAGRAELVRVLDDPSQFFATVQATDDLVLLELWHRSAFLPQNCGLVGNPGGKSRTLAYDPKKGRITSTKFWQ